MTDDDVSKIQAIFERTKTIEIDARPGFNQKVISRFRFLGEEKFSLKWWFAIPAIRYFLLPVLAGATAYFGARAIKEVISHQAEPASGLGTGQNPADQMMASPTESPSESPTPEESETPEQAAARAAKEAAARSAQSSGVSAVGKAAQGSLTVYGANTGKKAESSKEDAKDENGDSVDHDREKDSDKRAGYQGPHDLVATWDSKATHGSVALLSWKINPDEEYSFTIVEVSHGDANHFVPSQTLKGTEASFSWTGSIEAGKDIYFRVVSTAPLLGTMFTSLPVKLSTKAVSAPTLFVAPAPKDQIVFKWSLPSGIPAQTTMVVEADFNHSGYSELARVPAANMQYSMTFKSGNYFVTCGAPASGGCLNQKFRIHLEGAGGVVSPYSPPFKKCMLSWTQPGVMSNTDADIKLLCSAVRKYDPYGIAAKRPLDDTACPDPNTTGRAWSLAQDLKDFDLNGDGVISVLDYEPNKFDSTAKSHPPDAVDGIAQLMAGHTVLRTPVQCE